MPTNLRELVDLDLAISIEGDWALPVELTGPNGSQSVVGMILYDTITLNLETGQPIIANNPVVVLRVASLNPVPKAGETWMIKIPTTPSLTATKQEFIMDSDRAPEGGASIGYVKLYLRKVVQDES